jgi:hypothetical protein
MKRERFLSPVVDEIGEPRVARIRPEAPCGSDGFRV